MTASRFPFLNQTERSSRISSEVELILIDLFCGSGGTTLGFYKAIVEGKKVCKIIAAINHDKVAIKSHWANHKDVFHFEEDIRSLDLTKLVELVNLARKKYPNAKVVLWASLECTNFSKAKGGQERDADSRTLAKSLYMQWNESLKSETHDGYIDADSYIQLLQPDYVMIENVVEFMSWGEMKNGKPVSRKNGIEWLKWRQEIKNLGYVDDWKEINSADFGAHTSRNRLFGIFAKQGLPLLWPQPTHAKDPKKGMFRHLKRWRPVKEVLNFDEEGESIFDVMHVKTYKKAKEYLNIKKKKKKSKKGEEAMPRTIVIFPADIETPQFGMEPKAVITQNEVHKFDDYIESYLAVTGFTMDQIKFYRYDPYSEKTLERLYAGCIKFVAGGKEAFTMRTYATASNTDGVFDINNVNPTITTREAMHLVQPAFISKYNTGKAYSRNTSIEEPLRTIVTENRHALVQPKFMMQANNSNSPGSKTFSLESPARTLTCKGGNQYVVNPCFIMKYYSGKPDGKNITVEGPAGTICTAGTQSLVQPKFLAAHYSNGENVSSVDQPCPTISTKDRFELVEPQFLLNYNHSSKADSINAPAPTLVTRDKLAKVKINWLDKQFTGEKNNQSIEQPSGSILPNDKHALVSAKYFIDRNFTDGGGKNSSIDQPAGSILSVPKMNLVYCEPFILNTNYNNVGSSIDQPCPVLTASRRHYYLLNPQWNVTHNTSVDKPCFTLIARMDKSPPYLVQIDTGEIAIIIYDSDSPYMKLIKKFMAMYGIIDIKMRMLLISELKKIQGFPEKYILQGSQTDQKKFIGNSVVPKVPQRMAEALVPRLRENRLIKAA